MKKTLIAGVMFFALASPLLASAQVDVNASTTASTTQQAYQYSLRQVISLLMKQVEVLIAQLATLNAQQTNLQSQIQTLTTNGIISTPAPVYGASNQTPVQSEDKTSLTATIKQVDQKGIYPDVPFGQWIWTVIVTDKDGNSVGNHVVDGSVITVPLTIVTSKDGQTLDTRQEEINNYLKGGIMGKSLAFVPTSAGNYSLTFTANGLSKTIDVVVN
jgi:hypothetical protein